MSFWVPLIALLVISALLAGKYAYEARENGDIDRLNEATDDLKRSLREAFEPSLQRLVKWLNRNPSDD
jgi:hypothetical protein